MRHVFKFPDIGEGIAEGNIVEWYVKKGDEIEFGEPIVKMETDKVVTDIPSPKDGVIVARYGKEGETINVGDALVEIEIEGVEGEEAQETAKEIDEKPAVQEQVEEKGFGVVGTIEVANDNAFLPAGNEGREEEKKEEVVTRKALATPVARKMAKDLGVDINKVKGSGPAGRVMKADIKKAHEELMRGTPDKPSAPASSAPAQEGDRVVYEPMSQIRKAIARTMSISKQTAAHMTAMEEVEVSNLIEIRNRYKNKFKEKGSRLTYLAFIMKAVAKAMPEFPMLNAEADMENGRTVLKKYYDFNIAVDTPDGLTVPVIRDVDKKSIFQISQEIDEVAERARKRELTLQDLQGGTFTITNYGALGGTYGVPVLNYPQVGILGVGRIMNVPVVKDGEVVPGNILPLSISVDHRIVDGGDTARFLNQVMGYLKDPVSLLLY
jgi:pyruvate dehydrogenase E2 component (dihydrolipoamide acetyltransferase)